MLDAILAGLFMTGVLGTTLTLPLSVALADYKQKKRDETYFQEALHGDSYRDRKNKIIIYLYDAIRNAYESIDGYLIHELFDEMDDFDDMLIEYLSLVLMKNSSEVEKMLNSNENFKRDVVTIIQRLVSDDLDNYGSVDAGMKLFQISKEEFNQCVDIVSSAIDDDESFDKADLIKISDKVIKESIDKDYLRKNFLSKAFSSSEFESKVLQLVDKYENL